MAAAFPGELVPGPVPLRLSRGLKSAWCVGGALAFASPCAFSCRAGEERPWQPQSPPPFPSERQLASSSAERRPAPVQTKSCPREMACGRWPAVRAWCRGLAGPGLLWVSGSAEGATDLLCQGGCWGENRGLPRGARLSLEGGTGLQGQAVRAGTSMCRGRAGLASTGPGGE